jgi:hypothetical protein
LRRWGQSLWIRLPLNAQTLPPSVDAPSPKAEPTNEQARFDRLELLAFIVGNFDTRSAVYEIQKRGLSFARDEELAAAVRVSGAAGAVIQALRGAKPQDVRALASQGEAALDAVTGGTLQTIHFLGAVK